MVTRNLAIRFLSAAVLIPFFLGMLYIGGFPFQSLMLLGCLWCGYEWLQMLNNSQQKRVWIIVLFCLALTWGVFLQTDVNAALLVCLSVSLALMLGLKIGKVQKPVLLSMGISYLGPAMLGLMHIREWGGYSLAAFVCAVVWLTDTGAYFFGRALKGARLAPDISPSKTWAGLMGGFVTAAVMGYFCSWLFHAPKPHVVVLVALGLAFGAHCGDLFESWVKRQAGVKDSGMIIPGHGGLLDRVDGLIMAILMFSVALWANQFDLTWWKQ